MSLTCSCDGGGDYDWMYVPPEDYALLATKRARRCCSCNAKVSPGELSAKFARHREPANDIEYRIHGDEVQMRPWFMCETCADLYFSIAELGYCVELTKGESMRELAAMTAGIGS